MPDIILGGFGTDVTPPEVTNNLPIGIDASRFSNVSFDITDTETGVDLTFLTVVVDGNLAYDWDGVGVPNDGFKSGYNGPASAITGPVGGTYHVVVDPTSAFGNWKNIPVAINAQDLAPSPNIMSEFLWIFRTADTVSPAATNAFPTGIGVSISTWVTFDVIDDGAGVDLANTTIQIGGVTVYDWDGTGDREDGFQPGWETSSFITDILSPPNPYPGFRFEIKKNTDYAEWTNYTVDVYLQDLATVPNTNHNWWTFQTEDLIDPVISNVTPTGIGVPVDQDVEFDITDSGSGVDLSTLDVVLDSSSAVIGGVASPGYSLITSDIPNGKHCVVGHPDFSGWYTVNGSIYVEDVAGNSDSFNWSFDTEDVDPPFVLNNLPTGLSEPVGTNVSFDIKDLASGVDLESLVVVIGSDTVYDWDGTGVPNDGFKTGYRGPASNIGTIANGYHVVVDKETDFVELTAFLVVIDAMDIAGNPMTTFNWSFTTRSSDVDPPYITDIYPVPGTGTAPTDTFISFWLRDDHSGVDVSTIYVEIDGVPAVIGSGIQSGFNGIVESGSPIYKITVRPNAGFVARAPIVVDVYCEDIGLHNPFSTSFTFSTGVRKPFAVLTYNQIEAIFGSMIQLDGRKSYDPDSLPLTFSWAFTRKPIGSNVVTFTPIRPHASAVSFIPDKIGVYEVQLTVNNGYLNSDPATANVLICVSQTPCGTGVIPDAGFLWNALSNFWSLVEDRQYIESIWSATIQLLGADYLKLWANDYSKSFDTIRESVPRRWQQFKMYTDVTNESQRIIAGYTSDGTSGRSGTVSPVDHSETIGYGTVATGESFVAKLTLESSSIVIPGTVYVWAGAAQVAKDDGLGHLVGISGYGASGQIDTTTGDIIVRENVGVNIWGAGVPVVVTFQTASEYSDQFYLPIISKKKLATSIGGVVLETFTNQETQQIATGLATPNQLFTGDLLLPPGISISPNTVSVWRGVPGVGTQVGTVDSSGNITGYGVYSLEGALDFDTGHVEVREHGNVWGAGDGVWFRYYPNVLEIPLERGILPYSVTVIHRRPSTGVETVVATEGVSGILAGTNMAGAVNHATGAVSVSETLKIFAAGDEVWIQYKSAATDLTTLNTNQNARGRVLAVNGDGFTVDRVYNTDTDTVIVVNEQAIPGGLVGATWRIPHLLHIPTVDLEDFMVSTGDVIVFDVTRKDIGLSAELRGQVIGVDRDRVGFEFTMADLETGIDAIDRGQFQQLVQDLKIVPAESSTSEIAAAAEALISFMPTGVNLVTRPFTPYRITIRAKKIIHNTRLRIYDRYLVVPTLQEDLYEPGTILRHNLDYVVGDGELRFQPGVFTPGSPAPDMLWAECSMINNDPVIESNFGRLVGVPKEALTNQLLRISYLSSVKGLWYAVMNGPTFANIRLGLQIIMGLPYAESRGLIIQNNIDFASEPSGLMLSRLLVEDLDEYGNPTGRRRIYYYPTSLGLEINPSTGLTYALGDIVEQWAPLSKGVEVEDYVKDPEWWKKALAGQEILKYFVFRAVIDAEVFTLDDVLAAVDFLNKIKPAYVRVITSALKRLTDDPLDGFEDTDRLFITARKYDNVGFGIPVALRPDHYNFQGVEAWTIGSHPFALRSTSLLRDVTTREGLGPYAGKIIAESLSGFAQVGVFSQQHLGTGTSGLNDTFTAVLAAPVGSQIQKWSVRARNGGTGTPGTGDQVAADDGTGYVFGKVGDVVVCSGRVDYAAKDFLLAESAAQVWDAGESADVDYYAVGPAVADCLRGRARPDPALGSTRPSVEGDILIILRGQPGAGELEHGYYEIETVISPTQVVLRNFADRVDPETLVIGDAPGDPGYIDSAVFQTGSNLRCCVVRRIQNPVLTGIDMVFVGGDNVANSLSAKFLTDSVSVDDHIVVESGANAGEYRVKEVTAEDEVVLTGMSGVDPTFTADTDVFFRCIKPVIGTMVFSGARSRHVVDHVEFEVMDLGDPSGPPKDVFTPEMVGLEIRVADSQNPANDGLFKIVEYIHAGKIKTNATYSPGADDTTSVATGRIGPKYTATSWHSGWHRGFERYDDMYPFDVVEAFLST